jgi:hypothetical protein
VSSVFNRLVKYWSFRSTGYRPQAAKYLPRPRPEAGLPVMRQLSKLGGCQIDDPVHDNLELRRLILNENGKVTHLYLSVHIRWRSARVDAAGANSSTHRWTQIHEHTHQFAPNDFLDRTTVSFSIVRNYLLRLLKHMLGYVYHLLCLIAR